MESVRAMGVVRALLSLLAGIGCLCAPTLALGQTPSRDAAPEIHEFDEEFWVGELPPRVAELWAQREAARTGQRRDPAEQRRAFANLRAQADAFWADKQSRTIWYVDDDAPGDPGPGDPLISDPAEDGSETHPFDALQEALDAAAEGDEIIAADGVYRGEGNRGLSYGGKDIILRSANGPHACTIDCEYADRGVAFDLGETLAAELRGFTITRGAAQYGGGIDIAEDSAATVRDCRVVRCQIRADNHGFGGGVRVDGSLAHFADCLIAENLNSSYYSRGGGVAVNWTDAAVVFERCRVADNDSGPNGLYGGGGLYIAGNDTAVILDDCVVEGNTCAGQWMGGGGLLLHWSATCVATNCVFRENKVVAAVGSGGGIALRDTSAATLVNCLITGNSALGGSGVGGTRYSISDPPPQRLLR